MKVEREERKVVERRDGDWEIIGDKRVEEIFKC